MRSSVRAELLLEAERMISELGVDFDDASNIIVAVMASLKRKYGPEQLWDVQHYCDCFLQALDRGPSLDPEVDEMALAKESSD